MELLFSSSQNHILDYMVHVLLLGSIVSFYRFERKQFSVIFFSIAWFVALFVNQVEVISLISLLILGILMYLFYNKNYNKYFKFLLFFVITLMCIFLFLHKVPGYNNWKVLSDIKLSDHSVNFSLWLNFDKTMVGFLFLLFSHIKFKSDVKLIFSRDIILLFITSILTILIVGFSISFLNFDFKIPHFGFLLLWSIKMLISVAVVEELFFRGFIQKNLSLFFYNIKYRKNISLIVASIIFGVFHIQLGMDFVVLATVAGFFYGLIYSRTNSIQPAILMHFMVNFIHLILFTYPR